MDERSAAEVASLCGADLLGDASRMVGPDVVIDSRAVTPGALFAALPGEHADGHRFAAAAVANGAAAVLVARPVDADVPQLVVGDVTTALSALAAGVVAQARARGLRVIGVTGSNGKTSTKDLLAAVLEPHAPTVAPAGSFNNEIGAPLTALRVGADTRFLVSELGSRGPGHIADLCRIVAPDVGVVVNVGHAHIGEFGSLAAVARAKGELVEALGADGWAVLNADDELVTAMRARTGARIAAFSAVAEPSFGDLRVWAGPARPDDGQRFGFALQAAGAVDGRASAQLRVAGRHQVVNALAAAAAALACGVEIRAVARALSAAAPRSRWRMELGSAPDGMWVVNDAYNANPDSMRAALATVARMAASRRAGTPDARAVAVLGDMLELGETSARMHYETGSFAAGLGIEVIALGEHAGDTVAGARSAGGTARVARTDEVPQLLALGPGDVVVLKASRGLGLPVDELDRCGLGLERLVDAIVAGVAADEGGGSDR